MYPAIGVIIGAQSHKVLTNFPACKAQQVDQRRPTKKYGMRNFIPKNHGDARGRNQAADQHEWQVFKKQACLFFKNEWFVLIVADVQRGGHSKPLRLANMAASVLDFAPKARNTLATWQRTVFSLMHSVRPISLLECPSHNWANTSTCRGVR